MLAVKPEFQRSSLCNKLANARFIRVHTNTGARVHGSNVAPLFRGWPINDPYSMRLPLVDLSSD